MALTLVLPWFPILLAVGVGGRLLGRARGLCLGLLCALFWVVLAQASSGSAIWSDPWTVVTIVAGAAAIAAMGGWSGQATVEPSSQSQRGSLRSPQSPTSTGDDTGVPSDKSEAAFQRVCAVIDGFDEWLEEHRDDAHPWSKFGEFVRSVMYECCQATHVKPYCLLSEGDELVPLHEPDPLADIDRHTGVERLSARRGIVGHVVTTGRSYLAGDTTQGELVEKLAAESPEPGEKLASVALTGTLVWCFAIRQGTCRLGAVVVGQLNIPPERNKPLLRAMERLINQFWCTLHETIQSRSAVQHDPVSGLSTRSAFLRSAEQSLCASYRQGEPVAVAVVALEGLRKLTDSGRWDVADELIREVSDALRRKIRTDDRLGRFDGYGFILLLRRVDSELASLILTQLMSRLTEVCGDDARWRATVGVRCGVAGSGTESPDLRTLVSCALAQSRRARLEDIPIASDLGSTAVASGAMV